MSEQSSVRTEVNSNQQKKEKSGKKTGLIIGAVVAVIVVLVLVVVGGLVFIVKLWPEIKAINDSKAAYAEGERLYAEGDYLGAIGEYQKVIPEDKNNYTNVSARISECDTGLSNMLIGSWVYEYPFSNTEGFDDMQAELKAMGLEYTVPADLKVKCIVEFNADGKIAASVDEESADEVIDSFFSVLEEVFYQVMYEEGLSETEAKFALYLVFGTDDIKEAFREAMDINSSDLTIMDGAPSEFVFDKGILYIDGNEIQYRFDGDKVIFDSESGDVFLENGVAMIEYPIELMRE